MDALKDAERVYYAEVKLREAGLLERELTNAQKENLLKMHYMEEGTGDLRILNKVKVRNELPLEERFSLKQTRVLFDEGIAGESAEFRLKNAGFSDEEIKIFFSGVRGYDSKIKIAENILSLSNNLGTVKWSPERVYARIVSDEEYNKIIKTGRLISAQSGELIPAIDAQNKKVLDKLAGISGNQLKDYYQNVLGGSGPNKRIIFFKSKMPPEAEGIRVRGVSDVQEARFNEGEIEILK